MLGYFTNLLLAFQTLIEFCGRLVVLFLIHEVPGPNFGLETGHPDWGFVLGLPKSHPANTAPFFSNHALASLRQSFPSHTCNFCRPLGQRGTCCMLNDPGL